MEDEEKTDPGRGSADAFSTIGTIFNEKVARVRDVSGYLHELGPTHDRAEAFWRLAHALRDMLSWGEDLHRVVAAMAAEEQPVIEITEPQF